MRTFEMPFPTTRGALEQTLQALRYTPSYGKNEFGSPFVEYSHQESSACVSLRVVPADEALAPSDLLSAEHSVEWWGVSDLKTFYRLLQEATPAEAQVA